MPRFAAREVVLDQLAGVWSTGQSGASDLGRPIWWLLDWPSSVGSEQNDQAQDKEEAWNREHAAEGTWALIWTLDLVKRAIPNC